jgi:hypothetical protein
MRIERVRLADISTGFYEPLARHSFFASRGFLELWRAKGGRPVAWIAEQVGAIAATLAGVEFGRGPFARFIAMPDGCYGGVLTEPDVADERPRLVRGLFDAVARRCYAKTVVFDFHASSAAHPDYAAYPCEAVLTDISDPDWAPPDAKLRSQIRKASRDGTAIERFDWERHHASFLELVARTSHRHGNKPRYPAALYRALAELARTDDRVLWLHSEREGVAAASHIYFIEGDTVMAWQSYFDKTFSYLKPNQFIRFAACRTAAVRGIHWLNLGSTPAQSAGLAYYKTRWGGRRLRFTSHVRWSAVGELVGLMARRPAGVPIATPARAGALAASAPRH